MPELAEHILESKAGHFEPSGFRDRYEEAVIEMLKAKQVGMVLEAPKEDRPNKNVVSLMDALKRSLAGTPPPKEVLKPKKVRKRVAGQGEMLLPISGGAMPKVAVSKRPAGKRPATAR